MANSSIEIEIIADFKDNATDKAKALNSELDKLDKRKVNVDVNADNKAIKMADELDRKFSKIDGTATKSIDMVSTRAEAVKNGISPIKLSADTSEVDNALNRVKMGIEDVGKTSSKVSAQNWGYNRSAMDAINHYGKEQKSIWVNGEVFQGFNENYIPDTSEKLRIAKVSAKNWGYNQSAIDFMNAYAGEDTEEGAGGFWSRISPEIDKNRTVKRMAKMGRMYGSEATTIKGQALAGVGATTGLAIAGTALVSAGGDFMNAYASDNHNDTERSIYRGFTKGLLTVAGGAVGSFIAPGVGTMIGAGIGGGISDLFGDKLADSISGIHKSAEELKQDRLDEIFGDIAISAENLSKVAKNMLGDWTTQVSQAHSQALATGYSLQDTTNSSYFGTVESGSKLDIMGNLGFYIPKGNFSAYKKQVSAYMDGIEETMTQEMYNAFMVNDDLFGYGNWDTTELSDKWESAFKAFYEQKKELNKYLELALSDGNFSPDEREHVFGIIHGTQQTITGLTPNEGEVKQGSFNWLSQNGMLSQDSYDGLQKEIWSGLDSTIQNAAEERTRAGGGEEADKAAWNTILTEADRVSNASLEGLNSKYGDSFYGARNTYQSNVQDFLNNTGKYGNFRKDVVEMSNYGEEAFAGQIQGMNFGFDKIDDKYKIDAEAAYAGVSPYLSTLESAVIQGRANNQDVSGLTSDLMKYYEYGAIAGDPTAKQKYMAGLYAGDEQMNMLINSRLNNGDSQYLSGDFKRGWDIFYGKSNPSDALKQDPYDIPTDNNGSATSIQNQLEGRQQVIEQSTQKTVKAIQDSTHNQAEAINESNNTIETHFSAYDPTLPSIKPPSNMKEAFQGFVDGLKDPFAEATKGMGADFITAWQGFIDGLKNPTGNTEIPVQVTPKFRVKAGNLNNSFSGLPPVEGTANYELGTSPEEVPDATGVANYTGNFSGIGPAPTRYGSVIYTPTINGAAPDSPAAKYNLGTWHWANGTDNAPEGDAWVNDDGTSWPYELIEHNGEFRMYEGRNVLTRLEKGDRVYTSSETKDILSGRSIPRYAQGLNNDVINNIPIVSGSSGGVNVEVGGISVTIQIDGNSKGGNIVEQITSHSTEIAEVITAELERHLSASFANSGGGG
ncbi:hypothetical protein FMM68_04035 [Lachnospiraceae bacterium MD329]|nr:hypothetical protein [Lachnospiraceae bacterium MD329]